MTREITELDAATREQIAAGEVIERPASAVKELVENAIDADASRVDVAVEAGGSDAISVADDGVGMDRTAVRAAVRQHTTSKISDIADLATGVGTLGVRGEALPAIGAVSRMTITTRAREGSAEATELVVEGGEITDVSPAGRAPGTTVAVEDLFFNVPARRKYLKQPSTEFTHVNTVVTAYALATPDVAVSLTHDGRETFATTGSSDRREAVLAVYGREVADAMIAVDAVEAGGDPDADGPLEGIAGLVSHPETTRSSSEYCTALVNDRYVRSSVVREAVVDAYGAQLPPDRYPFAVLSLAVDPATVDVNVHPRKLEVRFADEDGVREQVRAAVEAALLEEGLVRSSAPRGRSATGQTRIAPSAPDDGVDGADGAEDGDDQTPGAGGQRAADPPASDRGPSRIEEPAPTGPERSGDAPANAEPPTSSPRDTGEADDAAPAPTPEQSPSPDGPGSDTSSREPASAEDPPAVHERRLRGAHDQTHLGDKEPGQSFERLPALSLLGQIRDTYLVAESADGLLLIDQHAADERIHYERLRETVGADPVVQTLAQPVTVEVTAREAAAVRARGDVLEGLGVRADLEDRSLTVGGVPAALADADVVSLVRDVCAALADGETAADAALSEAVDAVLADLACYPSVTGNTSLTEGSIRELLSALDACENPYACPHGRPVLVEVDATEIDARFERDYPGHGGRRSPD
jgi:DNA mismatch repair protein MutL